MSFFKIMSDCSLVKLYKLPQQQRMTSPGRSVKQRQRQSRVGVDGYGRFGSDEGEEMWVLELVTLVSVPQQQRRRLFLFYGRQNERAVLYGRQPGADEAERRADVQGTAGHVKPLQGRTPATPPWLQHWQHAWHTTLPLHASYAATVQHCSSPRPGRFPASAPHCCHQMSCSLPSAGTNCGKHRSQCQAGMA